MQNQYEMHSLQKAPGCKVMLALLQDAEAASAARWLWGVANAPPSSVTADPELTLHRGRVSEVWREIKKCSESKRNTLYLGWKVLEWIGNYIFGFLINPEKKSVRRLLHVLYVCIWQVCISISCSSFFYTSLSRPHLLWNLLYQHRHLPFQFQVSTMIKSRAAGRRIN